MEPEILLQRIIKESPKSIYGLVAKNCLNDKTKQEQFFLELYDDLLTHEESFTAILGIDVALSLRKIINEK